MTIKPVTLRISGYPIPATRYPLPATRYPLPATRYLLLASDPHPEWVAFLKQKSGLGIDVGGAFDVGDGPVSFVGHEPSKTLPMMLSCRQISPSFSLPSAARQASLALVPVPQGERS